MAELVPATYVDARRARSSRISLISIMGRGASPRITPMCAGTSRRAH